MPDGSSPSAAWDEEDDHNDFLDPLTAPMSLLFTRAFIKMKDAVRNRDWEGAWAAYEGVFILLPTHLRPGNRQDIVLPPRPRHPDWPVGYDYERHAKYRWVQEHGREPPPTRYDAQYERAEMEWYTNLMSVLEKLIGHALESGLEDLPPVTICSQCGSADTVPSTRRGTARCRRCGHREPLQT